MWYFPSGKQTRTALSRKNTLRTSLKKMIFILENMVFLLGYHIDWHSRKSSKSSHRRCSIRKGVLRNFAKFTGKDLWQSLSFNKVTGLRPATLLKKETLVQMFSCEFCEISKNIFFTEHLWETASGVPMILCSFMETFIEVFIYCFPVKKAGNLICRIEIWLLLQFIWLEIFCSEESSILVNWASIKETICSLGDYLKW